MTVADLGHIALLLALVIGSYSLLSALLGGWRRTPELVESARRGAYLLPLLLGVAVAALIASFLARDFSVRYVALHSNRAMEPIYFWVAFYAGNEGSLLYIAFVFSLMTALALGRAPQETRPALPFVQAFLLTFQVFLLGLMASPLANPFSQFPPDQVPPDGRGINPLLTHPGMFFHPPMQMAGLASVAVPFSFAFGHLVAGRTGEEWIGVGRTWSLVSWGILTMGILLGSWWAYTILGWGGYWAWDPVENAALLPWLPLTALIHSLIIQRKWRAFRLWNLALALIAYGLALYGMFMNRGGPVPSVHSFAQSTMGWVFLAFLAGNVALALGLLFWRLPSIRAPGRLEGVLSRETAFLANNFVFLAITMVVLWGVFFPLFAQVPWGDVIPVRVLQGVGGQTLTVARPFYDRTAGPLFLAIVFLMGVAPLLPWRRGSPRRVWRTVALPLGVGVAVPLALFLMGVRRPLPLLSFGLCAFVATGILREWAMGTWARLRRREPLPLAFGRLLLANRERYGGYVIHLGIVVLAVSVTASSFYSVQHTTPLAPGESAALGEYRVEYLAVETREMPDRMVWVAVLQAYRGGEPIGVMRPSQAFYPSWSLAHTRAAILSTPLEDFYVVASEFSPDGRALFQLYINPLVPWMWASGPILLLGLVLALWPRRVRATPSVRRWREEALSRAGPR